MVKVTVEIEKELIDEFRVEVVKKKGKLRGGLSEAMEEAIKLWMDRERQEQQ